MTWINNTGPPIQSPSLKDIENADNVNMLIELLTEWAYKRNLRFAAARLYPYIQMAPENSYANFNLFRFLSTYGEGQTGKPSCLIATGSVYYDGFLHIKATLSSNESLQKINLADPDYGQKLDDWMDKWT